ncbi:substrate-binding periplasmic protein [Rheinheimera pleomorphica]|uniref:substrate-binding periplasmic protein n=1 Tax=Rheinheimera pleomorphica TaxID=2703963 RepID=UPI0014217BE4|nr:transporter substrate-binding domain-containing protein [Rheinheimera pleomorphica]
MRLTETAILLLILLFAMPAAAQQSACQLSVRVESEQQSTAAGSHNATATSRQSYALLEALLAKAGCQLKRLSLPAGRAVKMLEDGSVSIMVGMSETPERAQFSYFIGPHHIERMVVVGRQELQHSVNDVFQLLSRPGLISVTEGAYYGPQWQQLLQQDPSLNLRLFYASGNQQKLAMLASDRVVATLEDEAIIDELLLHPDLAQRYVKLFVVHENPVYFAVSRNAVSNELYQELAVHWQQMRQSGEVEQIRQGF